MELTDVYKFVMNEAGHADLEQLQQAIKIRITALGHEFVVGDKIKIAGIRPKYLNGYKGEVTAIEVRGAKTLATIKTDMAVYEGRFNGASTVPGIPVECLRKLA